MSDLKSGLSDGVLVSVDGVEKVYQRGSEEVHVLANLDLEVRAGEFLAKCPHQKLRSLPRKAGRDVQEIKRRPPFDRGNRMPRD